MSGAQALRPLASRMTVSFVLMSPSIVMRLKEFATERFNSARRADWGMAASVVTTQSMVAMFGSIIPAPLAIPPTRNEPFEVFTSTAYSLAKVSLVMIAAAEAALPFLEGFSAAIPLAMRSIGMGTPIRPVEQTRTSFCLSPKRFAAAAHMAPASLSPPSPVQALAFPLLRITARLPPALRCSAETRTGAALTLLVVNVAAEAAGDSEKTTATSSRVTLPFLIPHPAAPATKPRAAQTPPLIFLISIIAIQPSRRVRP